MPKPHRYFLAALFIALGISHVSDKIDPYHLDVLTGIGINIILAVSLNLVNGFTGQFSLGHAGFMSVGAYAAAAFSLFVGPRLLGSAGGTAFQQGCLFFGALLTGGCFASLAGLLVGVPSLRLKGDYLALVTLGFGEIIRIFLNNLNRPFNITNGPQGITLVDPLQAGGLSLSKTYTLGGITFAPVHSYYFVFLICALLIMLVSVRLEDSRIGRAWIAIREDETAARAMGINTRNIKLLAFAMGATFGGISGGLFSAFQGFISPESFTLLDSIMILCMVVLGGMGHVPGVVLGAVLLTALPEALRYVGPLQQEWFGRVFIDPSDLRMLLFGLALVLMMLFRPAGLWPSKVRKRELST